MPGRTVGIVISAPDTVTALAEIRQAEEMGIPAVWLTSGGGGGDALTLLAAAATQTERILLGTSIVRSWSRHPVTMAEQAQVIGALAPGRFRLGVGPSHKESTVRTFGVDFRAPLGHLKEYLRIVKGLTQKGTIDFDGRFYTAHATNSSPIDVPVMASALRPGAFELCGAEADGAISWVCPHVYLRDVALPALRAGAEKVGRRPPPLIVHAPVCVNEDAVAAHNAVRESLGYFPASTFYAKMFATAGFPVSADGGWTDEMMDSVVIAGDELAVAKRLETLFRRGASEVVATIVTVGDSPDESRARTITALAQFAESQGSSTA